MIFSKLGNNKCRRTVMKGARILYKVVIVDDENIIVEGLKKIVDWKKYDCEVIATADEAQKGGQIIREHKPDILFTDIKMPNMDGLTMIAGLVGEFPAMQIAVLTGYRDFDYAKRALNLGVARFLLKPSKMKEIDEALLAMTTKLQSMQMPSATPEDATDDVADSNEGNEPANNFIIKSALKYIEEHFAEHLTLGELSEQVFVSQWYLSKLLNKYTEQSFNDLLNHTRIKRAKQLLKDPSLKIYDIATLVGFGDVTHFSRIFKKLETIAPNEYRNNLML